MKKTTVMLIIILMSINCKAQWNNIYIDSSVRELRDSYFINKDTGFVCGYFSNHDGAILRTYDGGENWQHSISDMMICTSIDFVNDSVGFSGGESGAVYKTIDRGVTWEYIASVTGAPKDYEDMEFINDSVGFAKLYYMPLYKTKDGGQSWYPVTPVIDSEFYEGKNHSIHFIDDSIGFVVGMSAIFKTIDQGDNWIQQNADSGYYYRAIYMIDKTEGFAVGNDGVLAHTIDGGANWSMDSISDKDLLDIVFISDSIGFIIGDGGIYTGPDTVGVVLRTDDKGTTWEEFRLCGHGLSAFAYGDPAAYIVGEYGYIFKNDILVNFDDFPIHQNYLSNVKVWPNPATNEVYFSIEDQQCNDLTLLDGSGKIILRQSNCQSGKIDVSVIPPGLYFLKASCGKKFYATKLIIK